MQIYGPYRVSTTQPATASQRSTPTEKPAEETSTSSATPVDQLDLSHARGASRVEVAGPVAGNGEIRVDRVAEIRRQISDGTYETPEKLDAALDRFLDQLA